MKVRAFLLFFALICLTSCNGVWNQFHGNLANTGFALQNSKNAISETWISNQYNISTASPIVWGNILYIATNNAEVVSLNSADGSQIFKRSFGSIGTVSRIGSTPAIADDGTLFVVVNRQIADTIQSSRLHKLDSLLNPGWTYTFPDLGVTTSSPKIIEALGNKYIFVRVTTSRSSGLQSELFVLRDDGNEATLVDRKSLRVCVQDIEGGGFGLGDIFGALKDVFEFIVELPSGFDESGLQFLPDFFLNPTPAILNVDGGERGLRLIAEVNNICSFGVYEWTPSTELLSVSWSEEHDFKRHSSPMITSSGLMVFGRKGGRVRAYDIFTGAKVWTYEAGENVFATPAKPPGQNLYVVSLDHIHRLHPADGALIKKIRLDGESYSSPVISSNHVHVVGGRELLTLSYNFTSRAHSTSAFLANPLSSPAIDDNGSIFAVARDGRVWGWITNR